VGVVVLTVVCRSLPFDIPRGIGYVTNPPVDQPLPLLMQVSMLVSVSVELSLFVFVCFVFVYYF
jgi:hypothetical protein